MLSTGLSLNNSIKQLERAFKALFLSICNMVMEARNNLAPAHIEELVYLTPECIKSPSDKITRTVLPDERLDYSQTFQHIRHGLEAFYKEHYHNFSNYTTLPHQPVELRMTGKIPKTSTQINYDLNNYPTEGKTLLQTTILPTGIAKTVVPDEDRNFNDTFLHIRAGLDRFYKEKNPVFTNTALAGEAEGHKENTKKGTEKMIKAPFEGKITIKTALAETLTNKATPAEDQIATEDHIVFGNSILSAVEKVLAIEKALPIKKAIPTEEALLEKVNLVEKTAFGGVFISQPTFGAEVSYTYSFEDSYNYQGSLFEVQPSSFQYSLSHNYSPEVNSCLLAETNIADEQDPAQATEYPSQQPNTYNLGDPNCTRTSLGATKEQGILRKDIAHPSQILFTYKDRQSRMRERTAELA